jgi:hypothetical protein
MTMRESRSRNARFPGSLVTDPKAASMLSGGGGWRINGLSFEKTCLPTQGHMMRHKSSPDVKYSCNSPQM